jgi:hypothetical protein
MDRYIYHFLTQLTIIIHLLFILFVIVGGFFANKNKWIRLFHICSLVWAVYAEISPGIICPLTTLENYFGHRAGLSTYKEDFITHYLVPVIYQENISNNVQLLLTGLVILINGIAYWLYFKARKGIAESLK